MPVVFPVKLYYPLQHELLYSNIIVAFGDGFEQRVNKNIGFNTYNISGNPVRSDGFGNIITNYKGINRFVITKRNMQHENNVRASLTLDASVFWKFYQDRSGNFDPFYFYNPAEQDTIDLTGLTEKGRYLVRFETDRLSREMFIRKLYNIGGIALIEVRE